jgi:hypothetical protein
MARKYRRYLGPNKGWWWRLCWHIFERAGGQCERCYAHTAEQIHHLCYPTSRREEPRDLIAVCDQCHYELHYPEAANDNIDSGQLEMEISPD